MLLWFRAGVRHCSEGGGKVKQNQELNPELGKMAKNIFVVAKFICYGFAAWSLYSLAVYAGDGNHLLILEGVNTNGKVLDVEKVDWVDSQKRRNTSYVPVVEFQPVNGDTTFKFRDNYGSGRSIASRGQTIPVLYARSDPSVAIVDKGPILNWMSLYIYLGVLFASILGIKRFS